MRKNKQRYYKLAFSKGTPTVFIIETPFQLLCAIEAIYEFKIEKYLIVVPYEENSYRWSQLNSMLLELGLPYKAIPITNNTHYELFSRTGVFANGSSEEKFKRIMTGGYYSHISRALCTIYAEKDSVCVYIDDGTATIAMLNGIETFIEYNKPRNWIDRKKWYKEDYKPYMDVVSRISQCWKKVGLNDYKFLYTIYANKKNNKFVLYQNKLAYFKDSLQYSYQKSTIWILGTVFSVFAGTLQIPEQEVEGILWGKLADLRKRYPKYEIIFIPHVDDKNINIKNFCEILGIRYERLPYCVEYYSYCEQKLPEILCGFGSTALSTFKIIFPEMNVINWRILRPGINSNVSSMISKSFESLGIVNQYIKITGIPYTIRFKRFIKHIVKHILKIEK